MDSYLIVMMLAVTVEALVEYAKSIVKAFTQGETKTAITQICAVLVSVLLCFAANANAYAMLGVTFLWPWVGTVLTGVFASRGANFVSDIIKRLRSATVNE